MKILQLCLRFPFPPRDGGTTAMASLSDGLMLCNQELTIAAFNTTKHWIDEDGVNKAKSHYNIQVFELDNRIGFLNTALNLLSNQPFHVSRFYNEELDEQLAELIKQNNFDAVVFESIFMAPYLATVRKLSKAICVLRSHNIEYRIWQRVCHETANPLKKAYLNLQVKRLKKFELETTKVFDLVGAITAIDLAFYQSLGLGNKAFELPFGVDVFKKELPEKTHMEFKIGFLGSMDWIPNQEGLRWFVKEIWPLVKNHKVKCHLAGVYMPSELMAKTKGNLIVEGKVDSASEFFKSLDLLIVPLKSGSGVRIKVLESMALGIPVLATSIGYEGISAKENISIFRADSPILFAQKIDELAESKQQLRAVALAGKELVQNKYNKQMAAQKLIDKINSIAQK